MVDEFRDQSPRLDAKALVRLLAEPDRRRVVAALILESGDLDHIVSASGLGVRGATTALDRLVRSGVAERGSDGTYVVLEQAFKQAARPTKNPVSPYPEDADPKNRRDQVIQHCFSGGRLIHMPRKRSKRLIVLDRLAQEFEPGVRYRERDVNNMLRRFDDDVATLRRYLVDDLFLDRADGEYWRAGGSVRVETETETETTTKTGQV